MKKYFYIDQDFNLKIHSQTKQKKTIYSVDWLKIIKWSSIGYYLVVPIILGITSGLVIDYFLKTDHFFSKIGLLMGLIGMAYNLQKVMLELKNE